MNPARDDQPMVVTASLSSGIACVAYGMKEAMRLVDKILGTNHDSWESSLYVGSVEFFQTKEGGPFPNHQMRVSARPTAGVAALNYADHDDPHMSIANSYNPSYPPPSVDLVFSGETGAVFPRSAVISIDDARRALKEWLETRQRPTCIQWRRFDPF